MTTRLAKIADIGGRHAAPAVTMAHLAEVDGAEARTVPAAPAEVSPAGNNELERLYVALAAVTPESHPRTARLVASSTRKVAQKVIEEAGEVALAAVQHSRRNIVRESADLLYHLAVLWHRAGIGPQEIWTEMRRRADTLGIAEKLPKPSA